jgi:class 3 adenylate cyclase
MATGARAELALAEGRIDEAVAQLREAAAHWREVGAPWEAARLQTLLAEALGRDGDPSSAQIELEAARSAFERLGAALDARHAAARLAGLAAETGAGSPIDRTERTFLFTDIVGSTRLAELLGDEDWEALRRWHHRTLQSCFHEHGGEVVGPHEGDGFFVAFGDPAGAVECAAAIQQRLAAHRSTHGFAPQVRIGAHTAAAVRRGGDYTGLGVHVAARVTEAGGAGEIWVTETTLERVESLCTRGGPRKVEVSPDSEPVVAHSVEWRGAGVGGSS